MATVIYNRPNFLASEVGLRLVSYGVSASTSGVVSETDTDGFAHSVVKAGTIIDDATKGVTGIVYQDVDVTGATANTQKVAPVMVAGHYYGAKLPSQPTSTQTATFEKHGLFNEIEPSVVRPFGATELE